MAEVIVVAGAASSFLALFGRLLDLVAAFRKAVEDVETAPEKTKLLSVEVDNAATILKHLEQVMVSPGSVDEEVLTPHFKALEEQLALALALVKVQNDDKRKQSGKAVEVTKALFRHGVSKQNLSTKKIRARIRELKEDLSQAVIVVMFLRTVVSPVHPTTKHPLVLILDFLENDEHSCWESVDMTVACSHSSAFMCPTEIQGRSASSDNSRAARAGGYEVLNSSKLRFSINYDGHAYFYFVVYDKSLNLAPELFFPSNPKKPDNKLQRSEARVFPDRLEHIGDPISFKVERDDRNNGTLTGQNWEQWVYLILSNKPLHTAFTPKLKIEDLQHKLLKMLPTFEDLRHELSKMRLMQEEPEDDGEHDTTEGECRDDEEDTFIAVKRYNFDIQ